VEQHCPVIDLRAGGLIDLERSKQRAGFQVGGDWPQEFPVSAARLPSAVNRNRCGGGSLDRRIVGQLTGRCMVLIQKVALSRA
jgi:hypothetical protein